MPAGGDSLDAGNARIEWADGQMPVLGSIRERFERERPLAGIRVAACLHVTAETAVLIRTLAAGGAEPALCAANPLTTQDEVVAALAQDDGADVRAARGEDAAAYAEHVQGLVAGKPHITLDDGADLLSAAHAAGAAPQGATEETNTGLLRVRALEAAGRLACPVIDVNGAHT
ncbi:MAG TPA: adenosylhomocysteinase, partial [Deinococcales bacterium]|nr:adenosylhomocysteinase [Deinococcales bacterium]